MTKLIKRASAEARAFGRGARRPVNAEMEQQDLILSFEDEAEEFVELKAPRGGAAGRARARKPHAHPEDDTVEIKGGKKPTKRPRMDMPEALAQADRQVRARKPRFAPVTFSELGGVRFLHFGTEWVQGGMRLSKPFHLELEYAQQMMSWLLFLNPTPQITQLGLGSASLTKWCYRELTESRVEAVELNPSVVIAARSMFALPYDDARLSVVEADAWDYVNDAANLDRIGVLQVDIYDATARGPVLDSVAFYRACRATLTNPGMLTVNLFGDHPSFERNMRHLGTAFEGRVLALPEVHEGNRIALAFSGPPLDFAWSDLEKRALHVEKTYRLPAKKWLAALRTVSPAGDRFSI